jgi:hypothetical protein
MKQGGRSSSLRASFATELLYNREGASKGERESLRDSKTRESRDSKSRESRDSRKRKPS